MSKHQYCVVIFHSISGALRAEKLLKNDFHIKLIPVPRHISSDCGICLRFEPSDEQQVRKVLEMGKVETQGIHQI